MKKIEVKSMGGDGVPIGDWLAAKRAAHVGDMAFIPPLHLFEKRRLSRKHNPFFEAADAEFFIAYEDGKILGRISAQINRRDPSFLNEKIGHFGFFDLCERSDVAAALIKSARTWLHMHGCESMRGPFNLSINEECGCVIEGFDILPSYLMPQSRPWTKTYLENAGLAKAVDLLAYRLNPKNLESRVLEYAKLGSSFHSIRARPLRKEKFDQEIRLLADIFNDAWSENWGFVPFSAREIDALAAELALIYRSQYGYFVEVNGEAVGVLIGLPNINEAIGNFNGRLLPWNIVKLGWNLFRENIRSSRIPLAGLRKKYQFGPMGAALSAALVQAAVMESKRRPIDWFEFSWILEQNSAARSFLEAVGAHVVSRYRIYEGAI